MKNRGITLIALIITIIIMLILAGIVLSLTIGENGIIKKAQIAGQNYIDAAQYEENMLQQGEYYLANDREGEDLKQEVESLKNQLATITSAITIHVDTSINQSITTTNTKVPLSSTMNQSGMGITAYNGGVKIGRGISYVEISGCVTFYNVAVNDAINATLCDSHGNIISSGNSFTAYNDSDWQKIIISPYIAKVNEGDEIYLYIINQSDNRGIITGDAAGQTQITVRVIQ